MRFYPYVIQIGNSSEVLFVNFASDVNRALTNFIYRHTHLKNSILRKDLFLDKSSYSNSRLANQACQQLITLLETNGYEVIAGGPLIQPFWQVYVIEIDGDENHLYVGETNYPVEKRFQQHVYKFNPARVLLKYDVFDLALHHVKNWSPLRTKQESLKAEQQLAIALRDQGYEVEGGH